MTRVFLLALALVFVFGPVVVCWEYAHGRIGFDRRVVAVALLGTMWMAAGKVLDLLAGWLS